MAHKRIRNGQGPDQEACMELRAMFLFHFILTKNYYLQGTKNYKRKLAQGLTYKHLDFNSYISCWVWSLIFKINV